MTLLLFLRPYWFPLISCHCNVGVLHQLIVGALVPRVEVWFNTITNIFCACDQADALQNNHMKNDRPLYVSLSIPNSVKIHCKSQDKLLPFPYRKYVIALGGQTNYLFPSLLPLIILFNTAIHMCSRILMHPILVNAEELVIGGHEAISWEVALTL